MHYNCYTYGYRSSTVRFSLFCFVCGVRISNKKIVCMTSIDRFNTLFLEGKKKCRNFHSKKKTAPIIKCNHKQTNEKKKK